MSTKLYTPQLFQSSPKAGDPQRHGFSWTTDNGAKAAGRRLAGQMIANEKAIGQATGNPGYKYPYCGTVKSLEELTVPQIKELCKLVFGAMRKAGAEFSRILEIALTNRVDWHIVFRSCPALLMENRGSKLRAIIHKAAPGFRLNCQFQPLRVTRHWVNYICKAKVGGLRGKKRLYTADLYAHKRLLFIPRCGLNKVGDTVGFWEKKKAILTEEYKANKATFEAAVNVIDTAAMRLADITNLDLDYVTRQLAKEYLAYPGDKDLKRQNDDLANAWYRSTPDYEEEQEAQRLYALKHPDDFTHIERTP